MIVQTSTLLLPSLLIVLYTLYVFVNARMEDKAGNLMLLLLLALALPRFCLREREPRELNLLWLFFTIYICLALASFFLKASEYIQPGWTTGVLPSFIFSTIIVLSFEKMTEKESILLGWSLFVTSLVLAVLYIMQSYGVDVHKFLASFSPLSTAATSHQWHWKNYAFWQVFLTWGVAAFFWRKSALKTCLTILVLLFSGFALFQSPIPSLLSESAILAMGTGIIYFLLGHIQKKSLRTLLYSSIFCLLIFLPLIWLIVAPIQPGLTHFLQKIGGEIGFSITIRVETMDACAELVRQHLFFGYGSGSTISIQAPAGTLQSWPGNLLPGGHPHNLGFLFLLEYGLVGLLFLAIVLFRLILYVSRSMDGQKQEPPILGIMASAAVLFSLSYSIWQADVVLTYCMFLSLLVARCSTTKLIWDNNQLLHATKYASAACLIAAVIGYGVR